MNKNLPKHLIDEINFKMAKSLKNLRNVNGRIDIEINQNKLNTLKQYGINGRFKENKIFETLINVKIRRFESGSYYTFRCLEVKVRSYKPLSIINQDRNLQTLRKPYSLLSFRFVRISDVE